MVGAFAEPAEHGVEGGDERLDVREHLSAQHLGHGRGDDVHAGTEDPQVCAAARLRGRGEQADEAAVQERPEALGGVQEVQGRAGRRGVDDDEVPTRVVRVLLCLESQLPELLHRHVLLGSGEGARDGLVERVGQNLLGLLRGRVCLNDLIEGAFHVQHHRVQRTAPRVVDALDRAGRVVELGQPQRLCQASGRVDGQHDDMAAGLGCPQSQRCRGGRLTDSARTAAHDDAGMRVVQQRVDVQDERHQAIPWDMSTAASSRMPLVSTPSGSEGSR